MAALRDAVARSDVRSWAERFLEDLTGLASRRKRARTCRTGQGPVFDDPVAVAAEVAAAQTVRCSPPSTSTACSPRSSPTLPTQPCSPACSLPSATLSARTPVGIVSGRNVENLARFGFPDVLLVAGSHGAERRGRPLAPLSVAETERLAGSACSPTGPHVMPAAVPGSRPSRRPSWFTCAKPTRRPPSRRWPRSPRPPVRAGAHVKRGHRVVELAARAASKAAAIADMRSEVGAAAVSFVGDDITDEDVFAALGAGDLGVRVGAGQTSARRRLRDPDDVLTFVRHLAAALGAFTVIRVHWPYETLRWVPSRHDSGRVGHATASPSRGPGRTSPGRATPVAKVGPSGQGQDLRLHGRRRGRSQGGLQP